MISICGFPFKSRQKSSHIHHSQPASSFHPASRRVHEWWTWLYFKNSKILQFNSKIPFWLRRVCVNVPVKKLERKQPLISIKHRKTVKWGKNGLFVHSPHIIADLTNPLRKCIEKKSHLILITNYELSPLLSTSTAIKYLYIFHSFTVRQFSPITRFHHDFFLLRVSITATINCSFSTFNGFNGIEVVEEARKFKWIANIRRWTESSASPFCVVLSTPSKKKT